MARFGLLVQGEGMWDGAVTLGDSTYFNQMVNTSQTMNPSYGYLWWLNGKDSYIAPDTPFSTPGMMTPDAPEDMFSAAGGAGQFISIAPSKGYIMVRQGLLGTGEKAPIEFLNQIWKRILDLECVTTSVEQSNQDLVTLSPNPARDQLLIKGYTKAKLEVIHTSGISFSLEVVGNVVDIAHLPKGIYFTREASFSPIKFVKM